MERRDFMKVCATGAALVAVHSPTWAASASASPRFYSRALLTDELGKPFPARALKVGKNYLFHYPFGGTPCFLLNLGKPTRRDVVLATADGSKYLWPGGVGPNASIVAFSAICAHRLAYPSPQISFISYREASEYSTFARPNTIHCCSEHSEYDPASGARVLGGPAKQPLAAILLEHDGATDRLYAVGTLGGELFNEFFRKYDFKLVLESGSTTKPKSAVGEATQVVELARYCQQRVRC